MHNNKVYKRCKEMVFRKIGDETLLIPICASNSKENYIYSLNPSAAYVLNLINGRRPLGRIKTQVADHFQRPSEGEIDQQLTVILSELKDIGAIE